MLAVIETRTNKEGIMQIMDPFKTDNLQYAESKVYTLAAAAVGSSVYVHTILCIDEHGTSRFNTPLVFEHPDQET